MVAPKAAPRFGANYADYSIFSEIERPEQGLFTRISNWLWNGARWLFNKMPSTIQKPYEFDKDALGDDFNYDPKHFDYKA